MSSKAGIPGPSVVLIVDQPQRDLAGLVLTAAELCREGITCHLVGATQRWREIFAIRPDLVLLFNLRKSQTVLARSLVRARIRVGLLDNEGAVWRSFEDYSTLLSPDEDARLAADVICAWSPVLKEQLAAGGWFPAERIRLTGCPRFDFYHADWRSVLWDREPGPLPREPGHVLLAPNYVDANSRFLDEREVRRELRDYCGLVPDEVDRRLADQRKGVAGFIQLARALAIDFPEHRVVLRPHPFEATRVYTDGLGDLPNVCINTTGPPQSQVFGAAAVIQRSSTIGIEARLAGVASFSPRWIPPPYPEIAPVEQVSVPFESYSALRSGLAEVWNGKFQMPPSVEEASRTVIRDRFYQVDGRAHSRVAQAVREHLPSARQVDERICGRLLHGLELEGVNRRQRLTRTLRLSLGRSPAWSFRAMKEVPEGGWEKTDQFFDASEVERVLGRIRGAEADRKIPSGRILVVSANEAGAYSKGYRGTGVTMRPA